MKDTKAQNFMWSLGFSGSFAVSSVGLSGGLVLFWLPQYSVSLEGYNAHCIDVKVSSQNCTTWRATFVYGEARRDQRPVFWDLLRRFRTQWEGLWICCGDFNEALHQDEHLSTRGRSNSQMALFRDCLNDCGLVDLGFIGPKYTWSNRQEGDDLVKVRLDRAVANVAFRDLFEDCQVENVVTTASDHFAISISFNQRHEVNFVNPVQQGFRFEAAWLRSPEYKEFLEKAWRDGNDSGTLLSTFSNLQRVAGALKKWGHETFGAVRSKIARLERRLRSLRIGPSMATEAEIQLIERELCELFEQEEIMARQRSRIDWLKEGDRNTAFSTPEHRHASEQIRSRLW
jgi:hypothetical protein